MKILVAIDLSDSYQKVLDQAVLLAKAFSAKLFLLHVTQPQSSTFIAYEPDPLMSAPLLDPQEIRDSVAERFQQEHSRLQQISQELKSAGVDCVALLVQGESDDEILGEAEKHSVDMIVLGTHARGIAARLLLGSTSEGVVRHSKLPVHLVPTQ